MALATAGQWVKFFNTAGIPSQSAATYAHIFVENRIQPDMLMDLNKEYLREMGVTIMGDIIAILRHAKTVIEQNARERVLSSEIKVPVAAVQANTALVSAKKMISTKAVSNVSSDAKIASRSDLVDANVATARPQPRRVLPEHEGRYKITLPVGTTPRSREILAKKAMLYADKELVAKPGVFDRLSANESQPGSEARSNKIDKQLSVSSSIFARLGGKDAEEEAASVVRKIPSVTGILKNSPTKKVTGIIKKPLKPSQKVILVKRIPAKAATMVADEYDPPERMETGEKSVSFSSEDEIVEIAPRRVIVKAARTNKKIANVKARLGENAIRSSDAFHRTRKVVKLKTTLAKKPSPLKQRETVTRMKSDEILMKKATPVHKRLGTVSSPSIPALKGKTTHPVTLLTNRIGSVSLSKRPKQQLQSQKNVAGSSSVFNRLGYNSKY